MILLNSEREVLLVRLRSKFVKGWVLPSGGTEAGETPIQTAVRELQEEAGITENEIAVLGVSSNIFRYNLGDEQLAYWQSRGSHFVGQEKRYVVAHLTNSGAIVRPQDDAIEGHCWRALEGLDELLEQKNEAGVIKSAIREVERMNPRDNCC